MSSHSHSKNDRPLGVIVVGTEVVTSEAAVPDPAWGLERLLAFAKAQLAASQLAEKEAILQAQKSAVSLYWAGCALLFIRAEHTAKGRGEWTRLKEKEGWKDTTVNDAIRLYENAKTPHALTGLGITEAKKKFVYPIKDKGEEDVEPGRLSPTKVNTESAGKTKGKRKLRGKAADPDKDEGQDHEHDQDETAVEESQPSVVIDLNEIAQRLTELALNKLGKVDVSANFHLIAEALAAVNSALQRLHDEINRRLPDA